jgi:hypothetical protein
LRVLEYTDGMGGARTIVLLGAVVVLAACGGGSADSETSAKKPVLYPWVKGPSREFLIPGGDNAVQTFGREATKAEREQASRVIAAWMRARAAKDWVRDCSYLARDFVRKLVKEDAEQVSDGKVTSCPEALAFFGPSASGDFRGKYTNTMSGPIDSLRVENRQGFAQYHGNDDRDWVVTMAKENGEWRVAIAAPIERNK